MLREIFSFSHYDDEDNAFGNALGNSIVGSIAQAERDTASLKRMQQYNDNIDQFSQAIARGSNAGAVDLTETDQNIENTVSSGLNRQANRIADTLQVNNEAEIEAQEAARQNREIGRFAELESRFPDLDNARNGIVQREQALATEQRIAEVEKFVAGNPIPEFDFGADLLDRNINVDTLCSARAQQTSSEEGSLFVSTLGNLNSASSALLSTGILFSDNKPRNTIDWIERFTTRTTIPVNHLGTPNFSASSIELIDNSDWIFNSNQLSTINYQL